VSGSAGRIGSFYTIVSRLSIRVDFTNKVDAALKNNTLESIKTELHQKREKIILALRNAHKMDAPTKQLHELHVIISFEQIHVIEDLLASPNKEELWKNEYKFYQNELGIVTCKCGE